MKAPKPIFGDFAWFSPRFREQKRPHKKNHIKFLKTPRDTRQVSLGHPAGVPAKMPAFFVGKQQEIPGRPAGRSLFVPPGFPGTPGRCPGDFSYVYVPLSFLKILVDLQSISIDFLSFSISSNQFQSILISFNHLVGISAPKKNINHPPNFPTNTLSAPPPLS